MHRLLGVKVLDIDRFFLFSSVNNLYSFIMFFGANLASNETVLYEEITLLYLFNFLLKLQVLVVQVRSRGLLLSVVIYISIF